MVDDGDEYGIKRMFDGMSEWEKITLGLAFLFISVFMLIFLVAIGLEAL